MDYEGKSKEELIIELKKLQQNCDSLLETYLAERKQNEEKLRFNEELLVILNVTQIGIWDWDLENDIWYASPIYYTMLGYEPETGPSDRTIWLNRIHPEDREMVREKIDNVLIHKGDNYIYDARMLHADGSYRWHQVIGCPIEKDDKGKVMHLVGIRKDITDYKLSEERLKKSEGRLRTLIDTIPDLIWLKDPEGTYLQCNQRFEQLYGAPENEIVGKTDYNFVSKELADFFRQKDFEAKVAGKPSVNEEEVTFADGHPEILETIKTPVFENDGKFVGILGIGRNITERKKAETALMKSQMLLSNSQRVAHIGCWEYVLKTDTLYWNEESYHIFGYNNEEIPLTFGAFVEHCHPDDKWIAPEHLAIMIRTKKFVDFESRIIRKDGIVRSLRIAGNVITDEQNEVLSSYGVLQDITERKQDEERILRLNRIYAVLSNINQTIVRIHDSKQLLNEACRIAVEEGKFRMAWIGIVDLTTNKVDVVASNGAIGDYLEKMNINLKDEIQSKSPAGSSLKTGQYKISNNIATDDNMLPWRESAIKHGYKSVASFPLKVFENVVGAFLIYSDETDFFDEDDIRLLDEMTKDISFALEYIETETNHKLAREKSIAYLRFLEKMDMINRAILGTNDIEKMLNDALGVVLSTFDCDRAWLLYPCNPAAASFRVPMEVTKPEYPGAKILNVDLPMFPDMADNIREALEAKEPVIHIAGTEKPIDKVTAEQFCVQSQMSYPLYPKTGKPWVFGMHQCSHLRIWTPDEKRLFQEISRRLSDALTSLLMFQDLCKSESENRAIINAVPDLLFQVRKDGIITDFRKPENMELYIPPDQFLGKSLIDVLPKSVSKIATQAIENALKTNKIAIFEYDLIMINQYKYYEGRVISLSDNEVLTVVRDVTERKQAELLLKEKNSEYLALNNELMQKNNEYYALNEEYIAINKKLSQTNEDLLLAKEQAEESDKLKTAFLHNMSHEIRTPMNAIMGFSDLLIKQYNNKPKLEKFSEIINQRCNDLLDIVNDILDIAKIESGQLPVNMEECNLHDLFTELTSFFKEYQKRMGKQQIRFSLHAHYNSSECVIVTDKVKLKQIFINLISNAFKFTDKGIIEGGCKINDNNILVFYISDTGMGIPTDKQKLVFERFAQLKQGTNQAIGGTGLGLSIVKGLVNLLGGELWLESEPDKGSTFSFTIAYKTIEQLHQEPLSIEEPEEYDFSNKTILIVEDDIYNAEYIKEILAETGLNILYAENGKEAIQLSLTQQINLVLMDISLPDINGYEAIRQIKLQKPDLKIIVQTAYAAPEDKKKAIDSGSVGYISKPLKKSLLLSIINKHLL
jgi:PAS domain S-box-containing protein